MTWKKALFLRTKAFMLDSYDRNWHITGSYSGAAKYTGRLDFSDAIPIDLTIEGVFGLGDSTGKLILE